ncbi:MAG: DegT/DnrJ/EryC1/StrS family aminotransferase [Verrucomicrobia bacterium]|nr:DegT/DnrJ/EryC1/StrS family aminotransferase [Verrucomicrobiota bacterium]
MKVPFYGHVKQYHYLKQAIDANLAEVLESGAYVMGPMLKRFEGELARYHGAQFAIGVGNGTDAIWLTLMALGIGPGDEVITHPNTFFATAEAIWIAGATAVFVDSCPRTKCICPDKIGAAITPKTKAIIPVHLYGQCADMKAIRKIADQHHLRVIEDNAQAIGAHGNGFKIGELSDAATTSFIIQKNFGTFGDGGAVVTNNADIDQRVRKLRNHGSNQRNVHSFGFNSRLDDLHAGILSAKLTRLDALNDLRRTWAARYTAGLQGCGNIDLPVELAGYRHVYHLYVIETKKPEHRDGLLQHLVDSGIDAKTHYSIAIHQQAGYPWGKSARVVGSVANAEANAACCISLPMFPELTESEVDYVIAKVREWDQAHAATATSQPGMATAGKLCGCCQ